MLKFSLRNNAENSFKEVRFDEVKLSPDLTFITCICEDDGTLHTGDMLHVYSKLYNEYIDAPITVERFLSIGEFYTDTTYLVYADENSDCKYIKFSDNKFYYNKSISADCIFIDDVAYPIQESESKVEYIQALERYFITGDTITLNDQKEVSIFIEKENETSSVSVFDADGNAVDISQAVVYKTPKSFVAVTFNNNKNVSLDIERVACVDFRKYVVYRGQQYNIQLKRDGSNVEYVSIENGISGEVRPYIYEYDEEKSKFKYTEGSDADFNNNTETFSSGVTRMVLLDDADQSRLNIFHQKLESDTGDTINVYLADYVVNLDATNTIIAQSLNNTPRYTLMTQHHVGDTVVDAVEQNGKFYDKIQEDADGNPFYKVKVGEEYYKFNYIYDETGGTSNVGYVTVGETSMLLKITSSLQDVINEYSTSATTTVTITRGDTSTGSTYETMKLIITYNNDDTTTYEIITHKEGNNYTFAYVPYEQLAVVRHVSQGETTVQNVIVSQPIYGIIRYDCVDVEGKQYEVQENIISGAQANTLYQYVLIDQPATYRLKVLNIVSPNMIHCQPVIENYEEHDEYSYADYSNMIRSICYELATNFSEFVFSIENKLTSYSERLNFSNFYTYDENKPLNINQLILYQIIDYLDVPMFSNQDVANNLFQEDVINKFFVQTEEDKAINRIVDMDKDVYYPYYIDNNGKKNEVSKITINLHFRTRTLDTWAINEDYTKINTETVGEDMIAPQFNEANTNWFCFDMYSGDTNYAGYSDSGTTYRQSNGLYNIYKNPEEACYHSDLLYFLNFSTNDVFYQKSKLSKSFLRLLFYDSKAPDKQSLLYQATVWFDSNKAYKQYLNNLETGDFFNFATNGVRVGIGTDCEPFSADTTTSGFTFDDDVRLCSKFSIVNRYETKTSAEGFYLHLFKELTEGACSKTIYMKVMFNHAGEGQSCLFMLPLVTDASGNRVLWSYTEDNVKKLKEGVSLADVLDSIYIPITIKYEEEFEKFVYYFDYTISEMNENNEVKLNLFEIKLKDESN